MTFYTFGLPDSPKDIATSAHVLGGKGAGLVWMANEGVPVPPGFIIPTTIWAEYDKKPKTIMKEIAKKLPVYLKQLRDHFGYMPLLSVRSGARVSCPGMMDTILNIGLDSSTQKAWSERLGNECYADTFHRLVVMYGSVVKGIPRHDLEPHILQALNEYTKQTGEDFPDAFNQVLGAIEAVFKSWDNDRAEVYRKMNNIPREWGTAVTVQAMVFGNLNDLSGTGVLFTRNPDTGERKITGEFLVNAQGEDIVAGLRTPISLDEMPKQSSVFAETHVKLVDIVTKLEMLRKDVQDVEFTVQDGELFLLQTRNAKRSAAAAIRIALDLEKEGLIDRKTALSRITSREYDLAQQPRLSPDFTKVPAFTGIAACSGVVSGKPVFTKQDAIDCKGPCILVTEETTPDDIAGMYAAVGVVTMVGGLTSHAAVVARGMNRACVVGVGQPIDVFKDAEVISIDGASGRIWLEQVPIISSEANKALIEEYGWLLRKQIGFIPVLDGPPATELAEAVLYLGSAVLHTDTAKETVIKTLLKVDKLYLDLTVEEGSPEADYFSLIEAHNPSQKLIDTLEGLSAWKEALHTKLIVVGKVKTTFKTVAVSGDLRSIIMAENEFLVGALDLNDPAVVKVLAWKQLEGPSLLSLGQFLSSAKSALSVQQAMHLVKGAA